jgi:hypothetical protein
LKLRRKFWIFSESSETPPEAAIKPPDSAIFSGTLYWRAATAEIRARFEISGDSSAPAAEKAARPRRISGARSGIPFPAGKSHLPPANKIRRRISGSFEERIRQPVMRRRKRPARRNNRRTIRRAAGDINLSAKSFIFLRSPGIFACGMQMPAEIEISPANNAAFSRQSAAVVEIHAFDRSRLVWFFREIRVSERAPQGRCLPVGGTERDYQRFVMSNAEG